MVYILKFGGIRADFDIHLRMVPLKDIARVVNGLSLVAKEAIGRRSADTLIKGALLSATDAAGLTKGNLRILDTPRTHTDNNNNNSHGDTGSSVVYFDNHNRNNDKDEWPHDASETLPTPAADAAVALPIPSTSNPDSHSQTESYDPSTSTRAPSTVIDVDGNHRRKPRERRVPSTPFSRAIG